MPNDDIAGIDYLRPDTALQRKLKVPINRVVVDSEEWDRVVKFFNKNPQFECEVNQTL